ncbi:pyruvate phosphate dikinase PEP/pyruvate- binding protein [Denitrovibrio acetiphilus DSM 12809]|uniref:Phosphoenolpyruvate synthase n=1 Tax=Denitrovibrio acetiphilus (strain DSM 12809 / NBRC 114555 / N2460) TaxID=522772 RepID=D4H2E8_DENA2|nr:PEP/pyruvate-binding domain-containing protein [Denitrovibrio acetiphilus]ADD68939.1 pyruvate phosphate dikinase PEP/pyruvate- binding protein [Denitrovibrio acetiphilus DSM 12809]
MKNDELISTGNESLDSLLSFLRRGDNVVWHTPSVEEYRKFVRSYVDEALIRGNEVHYIRFAEHDPLLEPGIEGVVLHELNASAGFESFSKLVHEHIQQAGERSYFVFDCLSSLLSHWATDSMIANLFMVTCPYLYKLKAMAYFAILKNHHSYSTINKIKNTTQLFLELYKSEDGCYVHPQKVYERSSPTMFLPHKLDSNGCFHPVANSIEATGLFYTLCSLSASEQKKLDAWDRMILQAKEVLASSDLEKQAEVFNTIAGFIIGRDERILQLAKKHFTLRDLISIKARMIGTGFIGGKAAGMLLARKILENSDDSRWGKLLEAHDSYYVGSDVFHTYIIHNGWWDLYIEHKTEKGYLEAGGKLEELMLKGKFPSEIIDQFREMLDYFGQYPIVVRSSSILEDGFGNAFAGKYESFFCSVQGAPEIRLDEFLRNLKRVYASAMCKDALEYRSSKGLAEIDEQMGILIQRVSGCFHNHYYYPHVAGVGLSYNTYVWHDDIDPDAGMLRLVAGLGTRAVNRVKDDYPRIVALNAPDMIPVNDMHDLKRFSQKQLDVLDTRVSGKNAISLYELYDEHFPFDLNKVANHDREAERMLVERGRKRKNIWILTFGRLLKQTDFTHEMKDLMNTIEAEYEYPVDIEFTVNFTEDDSYKINLVQCRPHQTNIISDTKDISAEELEKYSTIFKSKSNFMGGNVVMKIQQVVLVDPYEYSMLKEDEKYQLARAIREINQDIEETGRNTLLLGPGRWGTSTPSLGVPVNFSDINHMNAIGEIEFEEGGLMPELSFGSHFFQDLVESNIFFMALFPNSFECTFTDNTFDSFTDCFSEAVSGLNLAAKAVKVYRFDSSPLVIKSDIKSQDLLLLRRQDSSDVSLY